ncbi:MAG: peptidyl-prolyl cis-trans isomerase [Proteobacteria bacterium]|nr:peptidyl-prolyl cis-trans isomerase [Pseudomonadota bacterium]
MNRLGKSFGLFFAVVVLGFFWVAPFQSIAADSETAGDMTMGHGSAEEIVVVKVNGQVINMAQLMREMADVSRKKYGTQEISQLLAEKIKREATEKLITEELVYQVAHSSIKTIPSERFDQSRQEIRKNYGSEDEFQRYIKDEFGGEKKFRYWVERFLTVELYISQEFDSKIIVTDQEVQKAYDDARSYFVTDEFVQVNDLVFFLDPMSTESVTRIEEIKQTIVSKYNNDPEQMPTDGTFAVEKNMPLDKVKDQKLYEAAKGLKEYGWTAPVNVEGNLHIAQLIGYKPANNKSLKEVTPYLTSEIRKQKRQAMLNDWMAGLRKGAAIEMMDLTQ